MLERGRFLELLREENEPLWQRIYAHPFLQALEEGTLPQESLTVYIEQDYIYLIEFARCCSYAAARTDDLTMMKGFTMLANQTVSIDIPFHRRLAEALGIEGRVLDEAKPTPTSFAYINFLFRVATTGTAGEVAASLTPCLWTYLDLGKRLGSGLRRRVMATTGDVGWWDAHPAQDYQRIVQAAKDMISRAALTASEPELEGMRECFRLGGVYEYMFWDMAYNRERPV